MNRAHRRPPWIALCARLTLAAFTAALPGTAAWAQPVVERVVPAAMPAAFFSGTVALPSIFAPTAFTVAPALSPALIAAPSLSAAPLSADAPAAAAALPAGAPPASESLRSMSDQSAALGEPNASDSDRRTLSAAAFDGADNRPAVFALDHSSGNQALSQGEKKEAYDRMEQAGQHPYWIGLNLFVYGEPAAIAHTARLFLSARGWTLSRHDPISGAASRASAPAEGPVFRGPSGRTYRLVPGSDDVARDENGNLYRVTLKENGRMSVERLNPPAPAKPADPKEPSGLTDALLAHLVGTLHLVDKNFVEKISAEKWRALVDKGLTAMLAGLEEPHTMYYDQEGWNKYRHQADGNFTGVGIIMDTDREQAVFDEAFNKAMTEAGSPADDAAQVEIANKIGFNVHKDGALLKSVGKDSPADEAGLRAGDVIVAVDGIAAGGQKYDDFLNKIKGPSGSVVKIAVSRGGAILDFTVTRGEVPVPLMTTR
ncbi:MAG: S41 family peptidase, partial [Elusimicrobiota bacterium]